MNATEPFYPTGTTTLLPTKPVMWFFTEAGQRFCLSFLSLQQAAVFIGIRAMQEASDSRLIPWQTVGICDETNGMNYDANEVAALVLQTRTTQTTKRYAQWQGEQWQIGEE